MVIKLIPSKG